MENVAVTDQLMGEEVQKLRLQRYEALRSRESLPPMVDLARFEPNRPRATETFTCTARFDFWAAVIYSEMEVVMTYPNDQSFRFTGSGWGFGVGGGLYGTATLEMEVPSGELAGLKCDCGASALPLGALVDFFTDTRDIGTALLGGLVGIAPYFRYSGEWKKH